MVLVVALEDVLGPPSPMVPDALADVVSYLFYLVLVQLWQSSLRHNCSLILQRVPLRRLALMMSHLIVGLCWCVRLILLLLNQGAVIPLIGVRRLLLRLIVNRLPMGWRGLLLILGL